MEEYGGFENGEFSEIANSILGELYRESRLEEGLLSDEEIMGTKRIRTGVRSEQIPEIIRSATDDRVQLLSWLPIEYLLSDSILHFSELKVDCQE